MFSNTPPSPSQEGVSLPQKQLLNAKNNKSNSFPSPTTLQTGRKIVEKQKVPTFVQFICNSQTINVFYLHKIKNLLTFVQVRVVYEAVNVSL